jgi:hypothetical protein
MFCSRTESDTDSGEFTEDHTAQKTIRLKTVKAGEHIFQCLVGVPWTTQKHAWPVLRSVNAGRPIPTAAWHQMGGSKSAALSAVSPYLSPSSLSLGVYRKPYFQHTLSGGAPSASDTVPKSVECLPLSQSLDK